MVWEQFKVLCRAVKVGKSKSGKYKNYWNILDDQGYSKMIEFENDVEEWEEINYNDETNNFQIKVLTIN